MVVVGLGGERKGQGGERDREGGVGWSVAAGYIGSGI